MKHPIKRFALLLALLFTLSLCACGGKEKPAEPSPASTEAAEPAPSAAPEASEPEPAPAPEPAKPAVADDDWDILERIFSKKK